MNDLITITKDAPKDVALALTAGLEKFFKDAESQKELIDAIIITKPDQISDMQKAREIRLKIKNKRLEARDIVKAEREKIKFAMADFTLQDRLWLKAFQMLEATCDNLEGKCEEKEKFAERYEAEQKQMRYEDRVKQLFQYGTDPSIYNLNDMDDEAFLKLLNNERLAFEARLRAEKEAEEKRQAEIKAFELEQERIRKENEQLRKEAEETKRLAAIEAEKLEKKLSAERAAQQKILDAERKARESIEAKIKADKEAQAQKEAAEKAQAEAVKQANEEAARKKLLAPDKEKLMELAQLIDQVTLPAVSSNEANSVIRATESMLTKVTIYIREKAKSL